MGDRLNEGKLDEGGGMSVGPQRTGRIIYLFCIHLPNPSLKLLFQSFSGKFLFPFPDESSFPAVCPLLLGSGYDGKRPQAGFLGARWQPPWEEGWPSTLRARLLGDQPGALQPAAPA